MKHFFKTKTGYFIQLDKITLIEPITIRKCFMDSSCGWGTSQFTDIGKEIFTTIYSIYDTNIQKMFGINPKELEAIHLPSDLPKIIAYKINVIDNKFVYITPTEFEYFCNKIIIN